MAYVGTMFIRKSTRRYKGSVHTYWQLVESVRTPKGPRHVVVCSLGNLAPRPREKWLELFRSVERVLSGQKDLFDIDATSEVGEVVARVGAWRAQETGTQADEAADDSQDIVEVLPEKVRTEQHREAGSIHVGLSFWRRLGLDEILREQGLSARACALTCSMVLNRLVSPSSEHAMPDWIRRTAIEDLLGIDFAEIADDALYRNLDVLYPKRFAIESALVERERTLFGTDMTVFLYDLTSSYFEGEALANPKAMRGYSRDKRPDCKQVVIGLVVNRDGFPLTHEVFPGNLQDRQSLCKMLNVLEQRVGLRAGSLVVVDRGMAYDENIKELTSRGLRYLVASRQPERDEWLSELTDDEGFEEVLRKPSPTNPFQKKSKVEVRQVHRGDETLVLCRSEERTLRDRDIRKTQEDRWLRDIAKLANRVSKQRLRDVQKVGEAIGRLRERYPRVSRYYHIDYDEVAGKLEYRCLSDRRKTAEGLDGCYILKTNAHDLDADQAWRVYSLLTRAEDAFRAMKSPLSERPIFHQVERRVDTHIFLCVLALHLLVAVEKSLRDRNVHTSWATLRKTLSTHQVCTVVLPTSDGHELCIRSGSTLEASHREIYELLGVCDSVMPPVRTWRDPIPLPA